MPFAYLARTADAWAGGGYAAKAAAAAANSYNRAFAPKLREAMVRFLSCVCGGVGGSDCLHQTHCANRTG